MRTPKQAYDEALAVITQRIQAPNVVEHKSAYKLGLQVAIEQLRVSFHGVFDADPSIILHTREEMEAAFKAGRDLTKAVDEWRAKQDNKE